MELLRLEKLLTHMVARAAYSAIAHNPPRIVAVFDQAHRRLTVNRGPQAQEDRDGNPEIGGAGADPQAVEIVVTANELQLIQGVVETAHKSVTSVARSEQMNLDVGEAQFVDQIFDGELARLLSLYVRFGMRIQVNGNVFGVGIETREITHVRRCVGHDVACPHEDRKSTRLNSS